MVSPQKRSSLQNQLVFSPKACDQKKGLCLPISGFLVSKEKKQQMVSPQNGDTRGGLPPSLPTSDATGKTPVVLVICRLFKTCEGPVGTAYDGNWNCYYFLVKSFVVLVCLTLYLDIKLNDSVHFKFDLSYHEFTYMQPF